MYKVLILIIATLFLLVGCGDSKSVDLAAYGKQLAVENAAPSQKVNLFSDLQITNVTTQKDINGWYKITGNIKNNGNVKIMGYFKVVLYDANGNIVDSSLISVPGSGGLSAGESNVFSKEVTQKNFSSYKFMDETLMEAN